MAAYARQAVARTSGGWDVAGLVADNAAAINFPACASGSATAAHAGLGFAVSGTGKLLYFGALTASLAISAGITPSFAAGALTFTLSGGFATTEGENLLKLIFQAVAWADFGQDDGTSPATNIYVSLHSSSPGASGNQTTNEISYS